MSFAPVTLCPILPIIRWLIISTGQLIWIDAREALSIPLLLYPGKFGAPNPNRHKTGLAAWVCKVVRYGCKVRGKRLWLPLPQTSGWKHQKPCGEGHWQQGFTFTHSYSIPSNKKQLQAKVDKFASEILRNTEAHTVAQQLCPQGNTMTLLHEGLQVASKIVTALKEKRQIQSSEASGTSFFSILIGMFISKAFVSLQSVHSHPWWVTPWERIPLCVFCLWYHQMPLCFW